ncbi:uncharacterized protein LOC134675025 [Cydia fagiglandana]|uniref:uncharacterized protein LOC134675025 n=1 Tax=Cydia fagiglandana TaxID=1458189 RepID=UPI002FEE1161
MGNKKGRKPSASVRLKRKRISKYALECRNNKAAAQPPDPHDQIDSEVCHSVQETTNQPEPSSAHGDNLSEDTEGNDFIITPENIPTGPEHGHETKYGRRIVNVAQFFDKLQEISAHGPLNCGLQSVQIISETRTGLISLYTLECKMCNMRFHIHNDNAADTLDLNISAVAGTVAIGCGYTQLTDLTAAIGIPPMSKNIFSARMAVVHKKWEEELYKSMTQAAEEERELAIKEGRVNSEGIAIIDVIADGCYSKRSYRKNYSALSGAAAIIGKRTNKILYVAIKNKYCSICSVAQSRNIDAKEHNCFKNYSGPSTGMESEILVEGFKRSIDMHNLIYGRLISDGDANTYAKILQTRPYKNHTVEKIECRNHLLRNMCNKLAALQTDTKYLLKFRRYVIKDRIKSIRRVIVKAIKEHKGTNNVDRLYRDIVTAPDHAFGIHTKCKPYFCSQNNEDQKIDQDFFSNSIWQQIKSIISQFAVHTRSLIFDVDSNAVERYHSIVAKLVGGKRINFTQRYQYQMRCNVAALTFNTQKPLSVLHKAIVGRSPRNEIARNEKNKAKSRLLTAKYPRKKRRLFQKEDTRNYGPDCSKPDIDDHMMIKAKQDFLKNLEKSSAERERICRDTILQAGSSEWLELRRNILTASNFGRVVKRRKNISCQNIVKDILYKKSIEHVSSIKHGKDHEADALQQLAHQEGVKIEPCGLYIDSVVPYFGATPDGLISDQKMIVEIKCPKSAYNIGLEKAIEEKKIPFYKMNKDGVPQINKEHNWYYQIQGQLHVTQMQKCLFAIWLGANFPVKTETILRDDKFWKEKMERQLTEFYLDCLLPEIIDPRHTRKMPIRDPAYITEAINEKERKKTSAPPRKRKLAENSENIPPPPSRRSRNK